MLFIHAPKTGGMSLTQYLAAHLPGYRDTEKRHETLAEARTVFAQQGRRLEDFRAIFVVMRDPYALEISRYNYLRLGHAVDRGKAQEIALASDFKSYLGRAPFFGYFPPRLDLYYHEAGRMPPNLTILRHERFAQEVREHIAPYLTRGNAPLPHINPTAPARFEEYYDREAEELCYLRHRWFFDQGLYPRKTPSARSDLAPLPGESPVK